jgi:hypothetical protein
MTEWMKHEKIPRGSVGWLLWLFGFPPPEGVFVLPQALERLRGECTSYRIAMAAELDPGTAFLWMKDKTKHAAVKEAVNIATKTGGNHGALVKWAAGRTDLHPATRDAICKYASHATLRACCKRAGTRPDHYYRWLKEAEKLGAHETLMRYLRMERPFQKTKFLQCGLILPNLFIPSSGMLAFRKTAEKEMTRQRASTLMANLPGSYDWFADWVTPRKLSRHPQAVPGTEDRNDQANGTFGERKPPAKEQPDPIGNNAARMISLAEAESISGISQGVISRAINAGKLKSNGLNGKGKRKVDAADFARWQLERVQKGDPVESYEHVAKLIKEHVAD